MNNLKASYLGEMYKISKKKKIIVAILLSIIAVVVAGVIVSSMRNFLGINVAGSSEFSILVLSVLNYTLIPLFTAFICIDMISGEFSDHTIKITLTRPASRFQVYLSKALAAGTFILANLIFVMLVSSIVSAIVGSKLGLGKIIVAYLVSFFPLMAFALTVMLISCFSRGSASAFLLSVLLFLAFNALGIVFQGYQSFLFTSAFSWYNLFIASYVNWYKIIRIFLILCGYGTMVFAGGFYLFDKKEI